MSYLKSFLGEWIVCVCGGVGILHAGEVGLLGAEAGTGQWAGQSCSFRAQRKIEFRTETCTKMTWGRLGAG